MCRGVGKEFKAFVLHKKTNSGFHQDARGHALKDHICTAVLEPFICSSSVAFFPSLPFAFFFFFNLFSFKTQCQLPALLVDDKEQIFPQELILVLIRF